MAKERLNGEGTVVKRSDGRWMASVMINSKRKSFYSSKSAQDAMRKMKLYIRDYEEGYVKGEKQLLSTYAENWMKSKYKSLKRSSYDTVEWIVTGHILPKLGKLPLDEITTDIIQEELFDNSDMSYSVLRKIHQNLNQIFKQAVKNKLLKENPAENIIIPREKKNSIKEIQFLTEEQVNNLNTLVGKKWKTGKPYYQFDNAIIFLIYTGLRIGEALALTLNDYDAKTNQIIIKKNVKTVKSRSNASKTKYETIIQNTPKTKKSNRKIFLGTKALTAFKAMTEGKSGADLVITNTQGNQPSPRNLTRTLYSMLDAFGYEYVGLHALRHTFASLLIKKGTDIKIVSELLGHESVSFTYDTYVHLLDEQKEEAITKLNEL